VILKGKSQELLFKKKYLFSCDLEGQVSHEQDAIDLQTRAAFRV
jgi:hypothetical protein